MSARATHTHTHTVPVRARARARAKAANQPVNISNYATNQSKTQFKGFTSTPTAPIAMLITRIFFYAAVFHLELPLYALSYAALRRVYLSTTLPTVFNIFSCNALHFHLLIVCPSFFFQGVLCTVWSIDFWLLSYLIFSLLFAIENCIFNLVFILS